MDIWIWRKILHESRNPEVVDYVSKVIEELVLLNMI